MGQGDGFLDPFGCVMCFPENSVIDGRQLNHLIPL